MGELSDQQIITACTDSIPIFQTNDFFAHVGFSMMFDFGFRYEEIFSIPRWKIKNPTWYKMQPAKGGNIREIRRSNIPREYQGYIEANKQEFASLRKDTALRIFSRYFPIKDIYFLTHPVKTHIYRYSKCKDMYIQGYTYQQIADFLGEVEVINIENYVNAALYTP